MNDVVPFYYNNVMQNSLTFSNYKDCDSHYTVSISLNG